MPAKAKFSKRKPAPVLPASDQDIVIGKNIRHHRKRLRFTQSTLAHAIGYSGPNAGSYICRVEKAYQQPRYSTLCRIAEVLGVSTATLTKIS